MRSHQNQLPEKKNTRKPKEEHDGVAMTVFERIAKEIHSGMILGSVECKPRAVRIAYQSIELYSTSAQNAIEVREFGEDSCIDDCFERVAVGFLPIFVLF